jgi:predicted lipid-binding transport protein (Tim44 family)
VPSSEVEKHPVQTPDPHDEPSVGWGWHGTLPRGAQLGGWFVAILMFGLFIGNQVGHVQDFYLGLTGVVMIFLLLTSARRRRRQRR